MDIRPCTREEQLNWLISFLEDQIENYQVDLLAAKLELLTLKQSNLEKGNNGKGRTI